MSKVVVAVGSTRRPKVDAVREALATIGQGLIKGAEFDLAAVDVASGVRHTPLSREETMAGARRRAEALLKIAREKDEPWKYFVGLEGGVEIVHERGVRWVFLENWACVADESGRVSFGQSGGIVLPEPLASRVVEEGVELSVAVDEFAGTRGVRDAQGAWGVLTGNLITRKDSYRVSVISAFASFLGPDLYRAAKAAKG